MIACPECHQSNPADNRFCQYCGFSLLIACPHCDTEVSLQEKQCSACGGWLTPTLLALVLDGDAESFVGAEYLDTQERYLLSPQPEQKEQILVGLGVLDKLPDELSYLEQVLEQEAESLQKLAATDKEGLANPMLWLQMGLPAIARHYLSLQDTSDGFPLLQDAWMSADHQIIVLENRTHLTHLTEYLEGQPSVYEQVLQWMFQMAKMWRELAPIHCCQTLLRLDNLYIDEDDNIVVQKLIEDDPERTSALSELTSLWQILFELIGQEEYGTLNSILDQTKSQAITTASALLQALKGLAGDTDATTIIHPPELTIPEVDDWENRPEFQDDDPEESVVDDDATTQSLDSLKYSSEVDELPTVVLPMHLLNLEDAGLSDIGTQRDHNEDYFGIRTYVEKQENLLGKQLQGRGLYIVCDGMGGHAAGEVASALSVETLQTYFKKHWQDSLPDEDTIKEAIWKTNQTVYDINLKNARSGSGRMGTTLVMVLVQNNRAAIAHVGDSRIYRISRKWNLEQLTVDHEVGQREIQKGVEPEIAYARPDAYQLTQAIGPRDNNFVIPDVTYIDINEDSLFLLCSDGLSDNELLEQSWEKCLLPLLSSRANLDEGVKELIELANEHNGHDNITAVLVRVKVRPNLGIEIV
ncbi:MAG: serine/threonine phosphatase [Limnothrix sp. RL_2_0]|nr:serine/threonine phosphatase [Limnothrix sp. RL_2_0]